MNRDTFPAQNFQAISDLDATYYAYEDSVLQRAYEGYIRATEDLGTEFYLLAGHLPSWTTGGAPHHGAPTNLAWFKQYIKDALQYFKDRDADFMFADLINENWTGGRDTYVALWEALREVYPEEIPAVGPGEIEFTDQPDLMIPYLSDQEITLEGPSWHGYWVISIPFPLA